MENIIFAILIGTIIIISLKMLFYNKHLIFYGYKNNTEGFNDQNGFYCSSCENKTLNQCLRCFNCGYADFADGTGKVWKVVIRDHQNQLKKKDKL